MINELQNQILIIYSTSINVQVAGCHWKIHLNPINYKNYKRGSLKHILLDELWSDPSESFLLIFFFIFRSFLLSKTNYCSNKIKVQWCSGVFSIFCENTIELNQTLISKFISNLWKYIAKEANRFQVLNWYTIYIPIILHFATSKIAYFDLPKHKKESKKCL